VLIKFLTNSSRVVGVLIVTAEFTVDMLSPRLSRNSSGLKIFRESYFGCIIFRKPFSRILCIFSPEICKQRLTSEMMNILKQYLEIARES